MRGTVFSTAYGMSTRESRDQRGRVHGHFSGAWDRWTCGVGWAYSPRTRVLALRLYSHSEVNADALIVSEASERMPVAVSEHDVSFSRFDHEQVPFPCSKHLIPACGACCTICICSLRSRQLPTSRQSVRSTYQFPDAA